MTDHAGPRCSECPPGTKLWRPPAFLTKKSSEAKSMEKIISSSFIFRSYKKIMDKAPKTAPRVPKLGYTGGWAPQLSARVHSLRRGPAWSVIYNLTLIDIDIIFNIISKLKSLNCVNDASHLVLMKRKALIIRFHRARFIIHYCLFCILDMIRNYKKSCRNKHISFC